MSSGYLLCFFFKQKTAYDVRISDWSSDVCSSDLLIEDLLRKQGEPNAYIVGREAGGAIGVGLRYGSGTLHHKVEGERKVYWTGPSIGFDVGANAANTFVLVYNLWDSEELYERFPAGEGQVYVVGGRNASYLRKGDVVRSEDHTSEIQSLMRISYAVFCLKN